MERKDLKQLYLVVAGVIAYFLCLLLIIGGMGNAIGGSTVADTIFSLTSQKTVVKTGDTFVVNIVVNPGTAISGAQFDLSFNSQVVQINSVTEGSLFKQAAGEPNYQGTFFMSGTITAGLLKNVVCASEGAGTNVSTSGIMAEINCTAIGTGYCNFAISNILAGDPQAIAVPSSVQAPPNIFLTAPKTFSGAVSAEANAGEIVTIKVTRPDTIIDNVIAPTIANKTFSAVYMPQVIGTHKIQASILQDSLYKATTSAIVNFPIG